MRGCCATTWHLDFSKELAGRNIPFDLVGSWPRHLKYVPRFRERCPGLRIVVDHIGLPPIATKRVDGWDREREVSAKAS